MAFTLEEGRIVLHANRWKKTDKHPDYMGEAMIDGELREIAMWSKTSKNLKQYFSGTVQKKSEREEKYSKKEKEPEKKADDDDDDLPF